MPPRRTRQQDDSDDDETKTGAPAPAPSPAPAPVEAEGESPIAPNYTFPPPAPGPNASSDELHRYSLMLSAWSVHQNIIFQQQNRAFLNTVTSLLGNGSISSGDSSDSLKVDPPNVNPYEDADDTDQVVSTIKPKLDINIKADQESWVSQASIFWDGKPNGKLIKAAGMDKTLAIFSLRSLIKVIFQRC